jgi:hypothetical protein
MMSYQIHSQATGEPPHPEFGVEPPGGSWWLTAKSLFMYLPEWDSVPMYFPYCPGAETLETLR